MEGVALGAAAGVAAEAGRAPFDQAVQEVFYGKKPAERMPLDEAIQDVFYGKKPEKKPERMPLDQAIQKCFTVRCVHKQRRTV